MKMIVKKNRWGKLLVIGLMLALLMGAGGLIMPAPVSAAISIQVTGNGVTTPATFSQAQLEAMTQVQANYSTINAWPTKKMYVAKGVKLADLLGAAGIKSDGTLIKVTSTDGVSMTFTRKELLDDTRYYYPGLKANAEFDGSIPGSPDGAVPVDTILAMQSSESTDAAKMNDLTAPLLVMGQRWVTEQTNNGYAKYVNKIEVLTDTPAKWENPAATPVSGSVAAGTKVALSTSDMNTDNIYYTTDGTDPTFKSSMYNWIKKRFQDSRKDDLQAINHLIDVSRNMTIKAVAIGFGKTDSDIVAFNYQITSAPMMENAEVTTKGDVSLAFNKAMADPTGIGAEGQFAVLVGGNKVAVTAVVKTNTPEKIKLELATKVTYGQVVTVAYTKSEEVNKQVKSADSTAVESFNAQKVANEIPAVTTTVFSVDGSAVTSKSYSIAELKAMNSTTGSYSTSTEGVNASCKGVSFTDLLTASGVNASNGTWTVQINTTDAATYPVSPYTVTAMLDSANKFLLTYEVDGNPITITGKDKTTIKVYWSGKVIRNVTGITIINFAERLPKESSYANMKNWTISLNQAVLNTQVLSDHIYVTNSVGKKQEVNIKIKETDQKSIEVLAPANGYLPGDYTLWIKDSLQSTTATLKQAVKMPFKIAVSN